MSELITVCIVITLVIAVWFAACIDAQGVKNGIVMALGLPVLFVSMAAAFIYVIYSFGVVFG